MANIFTVKHGNGQPANGILIPFELGFDQTNKKLYIGDANRNTILIAPTLSDLGITASITELNKLDGLTATTTELNYCSGVTSAIQTQLNGKEPSINLTASRALVSNSNGKIAVSAVTSTELGYLDGVTSAIQTQLNGKEPTINLTASRALVSNGSGKLAVSAVTSTELGYLDGVTSAIQTQLNAKAGKTGYTKNRVLVSDSSGAIAVSAITSTELGYLDGVTSAIQTQLNGKLGSPTLSGTSTSTGYTIKIGQIQICYGKCTINSNTWTIVNFPTSFGDVPNVVITPHTNSGGIIAGKAKNTTNSNVELTIGGSEYGTGVEFAWIAIGKAS